MNNYGGRPINQMPINYNPGYNPNYKDDRLVGGFAFPFLLGGVTGAAIAPAFWNPGYGYNRPNYYPPRPPYGPMPPYWSYYR